MRASDLKAKFLDFFIAKGHRLLPNVSLVPENDPTALFINSGMHPLVPYLLGEPHPLGKRLTSNQRCLRTQDIESIGDNAHLTFFEMLGNWSLGDYWKKEAISWSWEFLTKKLSLDEKRISVSCFVGDKDSPKDEESAQIWESLGVSKERIYFLGTKENWWSVGKTGPCGPDTEMFYDTGKKACGSDCHPGCGCEKYLEIWNDVFMEFNRTAENKLEKLKQRNIDTGMGVERTVAMLQRKEDVYQTELFAGLINQIEEISGKKYEKENQKTMRIIVDHLRAATFAIADGVMPSNTETGYVVRRLIRRAIRYGRPLQINKLFTFKIAQKIIEDYQKEYPQLKKNQDLILNQCQQEEEKFQKALDKGLKEFEKIITDDSISKAKKITGQKVFYLYETYGFPWELTAELAQEKGLAVNQEEFLKSQKEHQQKSKASLEKKFAGGLVDHSEQVTKLHTVTHLLHQALRQILGDDVHQVGSNITPERLRFDFTYPEKLTKEQTKKIEDLINEQIKKDLPVKMEMMSLAKAKEKGALAFFMDKYGDQVKVYQIGDFSQEVCGGPHVDSLGQIGSVRIVKEEAVGTGRRRIYARIN
jgi:alanyl-tRNA synthetase